MKRTAVRILLAAVAALPFSTARPQAQPAASLQILTTFTYPRDTDLTTTAQAINNDGSVAGTFTRQHRESGYVRSSRGRFGPPISVSPTARTFVQGLNLSGLVAGWSIDANGEHGFFYQDGSLTPYDVPGANATILYGLNDGGDFCGLFSTDGGGNTTPFASLGGTIINVGAPASTSSWPRGINNRGEIIGYYSTFPLPGTHGYFRRADGTAMAPLDFPGASDTQLFGLNERGTIVGVYYDTTGIHGVVLQGLTQFTSVNVPGALYSVPTGLNNSGVITGYYVMPNFDQFGFTARLVP